MIEMLSQHVLVLNRLWQAVNICSVKRAMCLLYQGHAQVVFVEQENFDTFDYHNWRAFSSDGQPGPYLHTTCYSILAPEVILLGIYDRIPYKEIKLTRHNIFERDKNTCQYCGKKFERKDLNIDHVIPREKGGTTTWENLVCSCRKCNSKKANQTPKAAGMKLIHRPKKPKWHPYLGYNINKIRNSSWRHFIDVAFWKEQNESDRQSRNFERFVLPT